MTVTLFSTEFYLFVYPTNEAARLGALATAARTAAAVGRALYWSKKLDCEVRYLDANERFLVLENNGFDQPIRILSESGILGWVWITSELELTEHSA